MIKFFRKIRYNLINQNKTSPNDSVGRAGKYLKYALGEIILVVIGILIALQINTWNEHQKKKTLATSFLIDFNQDIKKDIQTLKDRIENNLRMSEAIDSIVYTLSSNDVLSKKAYLDLIKLNQSLVYESYFIPEKITLRQFEAGNNSSLIASKKLKNKLFGYYSENDRNEMNGEKSTQLYQHLFISFDITSSIASSEDMLLLLSGADLRATQIDIKELKLNKDYIRSLYAKKVITDTQTDKYIALLNLAEELTSHIQTEIDNE